MPANRQTTRAMTTWRTLINETSHEKTLRSLYSSRDPHRQNACTAKSLFLCAPRRFFRCEAGLITVSTLPHIDQNQFGATPRCATSALFSRPHDTRDGPRQSFPFRFLGDQLFLAGGGE